MAQTVVNCHIYSLHRNPKYWKEPEVFRPERFDGTQKIPLGAFIPWSIGARKCLGARFSEVESVAALACMVRNTHRFLNDRLLDARRVLMTLSISISLLMLFLNNLW